MGSDERVFMVLACALGGPDMAPAEVFADELHAMVRAA